MNYYVLYCQALKTEKICLRLNRKENIHAFIPKMEKYLHSKDQIVLLDMFPSYVFIETELNQCAFNQFLFSMHEEKDGIIRELKKEDVSALTLEEIDLFNHLFDVEKIVRMSEGRKINGRTLVTKGPLIHFQDNIVAVDKKDRLAILDIQFLNRKIKAGISINE